MLIVAKIQGGKRTKQNQPLPPKQTPQLLKTLEETSPKTLTEKRFQTAWTTGSWLRNSFSRNTCAFSDFGYLYVPYVDFLLREAASAALRICSAKINTLYLFIDMHKCNKNVKICFVTVDMTCLTICFSN